MSKSQEVPDLGLDGFVQCLTEKEIVMYGAYWCSHCQSQKQMFGTAAEKLPYVECTQNTALCTEKEISGYPTWITADGQRFEGELSLTRLAEISGCALP